jgi:hypothetical protein
MHKQPGHCEAAVEFKTDRYSVCDILELLRRDCAASKVGVHIAL